MAPVEVVVRIGELSRRSGVGVSMIKYYVREGMLPAGERTGAPNQAEYGEDHVRRLRLLRALTDDGGLPAAAVKEVVAAVDDDLPLNLVLGAVQRALVAAGSTASEDSPGEQAVAELVARRGWRVDARNPGWRSAAAILDTAARLGDDHQAALLEVYAEAVETVARREVELLVDTGDREGTVENVVTGVVLGDAMITALRAMAHQDATVARLGIPWRPGGTDQRPAPGP